MDNKAKKFIQAIKDSVREGAVKGTSEQGSCLYLATTPEELISVSHACLSNGGVFDSAFVSVAGRSKKEFTVYYLFQAAAIRRMVVLTATGHSFGALSANVNAALWDERKIQDLTGLRLAGIPDSRPILFHPESDMPNARPLGGAPVRKTANYIYPISGTGIEGEFEVSVGPVHAGIIEPGHFRFHVVGEKINKMEVRMFYLHRGIEKAAEGKKAAGILPLIEQISGDEAVANSVAYCQAVEQAWELSVPKRAEAIRTVLMELERIYSHLADLGGMPTDVGFTLSASRFSVLREDVMRLNQSISGSRFLHGQCAVGGVSADLGDAKVAAIRRALDGLLDSLDPLERMTLTSSTFLDRVFQTGAVQRGVARDLSLVGPAARACDVRTDLRVILPYSAYSEMSVNESREGGEYGDVLSRFRVKIAEINESARIIQKLVSKLPKGAICSKAPAQKKATGMRVGIGWAEAARGGTTFLSEINPDGSIRRLAYRSASFRNWRALEKAVEGNIVPDFPLINKSFNLSYAGTDA